MRNLFDLIEVELPGGRRVVDFAAREVTECVNLVVGITGVAVVCASASIEKRWLQNTLISTCLLLLFVFLWNADVGLQPIENMVEFLSERMTGHE